MKKKEFRFKTTNGKELIFTTIKPSEIKQYQNNPRKHTNLQIEKLEQSISKFGFINPVILDTNKTLIAGHGRLGAIKDNDKEIPAIIVPFTEQESKAYRITDNNLVLLGEWDMDLLKDEITDILNNNEDLMDTLGFDQWEIEDILDFDTDFSFDNEEEKESEEYQEQYGKTETVQYTEKQNENSAEIYNDFSKDKINNIEKINELKGEVKRNYLVHLVFYSLEEINQFLEIIGENKILKDSRTRERVLEYSTIKPYLKDKIND